MSVAISHGEILRLLPPKMAAQIVVGEEPELCWRWLGTMERGYGRFNREYVHRAVFEALNGPLAEGIEVDHTCRNSSCCNPLHLEAVTHQENMRRAGASISRSAWHTARRLQTSCLRGHPLSGENLRVYRGLRHCKECQRIRRRAYEARIKSGGTPVAQFLSDSDRGRFLPIQNDDWYKVILRPAVEYDTVSRSVAFPRRGISYVYGARKGVGGPQSEIIEVWFDRAKWTASSVMTWMTENADGLPAPGRTDKAPSGRPALAGGA